MYPTIAHLFVGGIAGIVKSVKKDKNNRATLKIFYNFNK